MINRKRMIGMMCGTLFLFGCANYKERNPSSDGTWGNSGAPEMPTFVVTKNKYLGNNKFDTEIVLKNADHVASVTLEYGNNSCRLNAENPKLVLKDGNFNFSRKLAYTPIANGACDRELNSIIYSSAIAVMKDGSVQQLGGINFFIPFVLTSKNLSKTAAPIKSSHEMISTKKIIVPLTHASKKTKERTIETYAVSYDSSPDELSEFAGIVLPDGKEILSDDPSKLVDFLRANKITVNLYKENDAKLHSYLCIPMVDCYVNFYTEDKKSPTERLGMAIVKLIYKGDISYVVNAEVRLN